jgi:hypothetical protein
MRAMIAKTHVNFIASVIITVINHRAFSHQILSIFKSPHKISSFFDKSGNHTSGNLNLFTSAKTQFI